jgi:uncharacterized protein YggE
MSEQGTIEATGRGVVSTKPEVSILRLGVTTEAETPGEAAKKNAELMTAVIAAVKKLGIPEAQIQTGGLNLSPVLKWVDDEQKYITLGYRADNVITVRAEVEQAGAIYDAGIQAGANSASGITFGVKDESKYRREALVVATKRAMEEIQTIAKALGTKLIGPLQAQVVTRGMPRPLEMALDKAGGAETPVMPGQIDVELEVRVVYAIKAP